MSDENVTQNDHKPQGHTPGPWAYRPDKYDDWGTVKGGDGFVICQARDYRFSDDDHLSECRRNGVDPWEANARLIAAAPDMLEALKEFVARVDRGEVRSKKTYTAFKALIAKAEGAAQ